MTALALGVGMAGGSPSFSLEESGSTPETYYTFFYIFSFFSYLFIYLFTLFSIFFMGGGGSAKGISLKVIKERSLVLRMAVIYPQFALIYFEKHFLWVDSAILIFAGHLSSLGPC